MVQHERDSQILSAKLRGPLYIWLGFVAITFYFSWQSYQLTGSSFHLEFPTYDSANPLLLPLSLCSILNLFLAWIIPRFLIKSNRNLSTIFIAFVIRVALVGSVTIYGLVCAVQAKDGNLVLPFAIFTLLGLIRSFPRGQSLGFISTPAK